MEKSYHHGNLKEELIKKGIELINEVGEDKLSLRKLAIICGVSNSAPYTHFKSKDELLKEMSIYIFNLLKLELENIRKKYKNKENLLEMLGKTYVIFFLKNTKYYYFLSSRKDVEIDLVLLCTCSSFSSICRAFLASPTIGMSTLIIFPISAGSSIRAP